MTNSDDCRFYIYGSEAAPSITLGYGEYITHGDEDIIRVGDRLRFPEVSDLEFEVLDLQLLLGREFLHFKETDRGYRYIIKFDNSLGRIKHRTLLKYTKT